MKKLVRTFSVLLALLMIITALPVFSAGALETTGELTLNKKQHVKTSGKDVVFSFTPENDGWYEFYSKGESDTYAYLSDGNGEVFVEGEDSEINGDYDMNFSIKYNLKAATTYYIHVNAYIYRLTALGLLPHPAPRHSGGHRHRYGIGTAPSPRDKAGVGDAGQ